MLGVPLLHVGRGRVRIDAVVGGKAGGTGLREAVFDGQHGRDAVGGVALGADIVAHQIVRFGGDLGAEINAIAGAHHHLAAGPQRRWRRPGQANTRREIIAIRRSRRGNVRQTRGLRQRRVIEIQHLSARVGKRREVFVAHAQVQREIPGHAPIVLKISGVSILAQIALGEPGSAAGVLRQAQQEVRKGVAGRAGIRQILRESAGECVAAARQVALQIIHFVMQPLESSLQSMAPAREGKSIRELPDVIALQLGQRGRIGDDGKVGDRKERQAVAERVGGRIGEAEAAGRVGLKGAGGRVEHLQSREREPRLIEPARSGKGVADGCLLRAHALAGRQLGK